LRRKICKKIYSNYWCWLWCQNCRC